MIPQWLDIGALEDIPLRGARTVPVAGIEEIAVFRTGANRVYALVNKCPHKRGPLSQGIVHGDSVACPLHNWVISPASCPTACSLGMPVMADAARLNVRIRPSPSAVTRPLKSPSMTYSLNARRSRIS